MKLKNLESMVLKIMQRYEATRSDDFVFESAEDIDIDAFFSDAEPTETKEEKKKTIKCPHCGEEIEV